MNDNKNSALGYFLPDNFFNETLNKKYNTIPKMNKLCMEPKKPTTNRNLYNNNMTIPVRNNTVINPDNRSKPGNVFKLVYFEML